MATVFKRKGARVWTVQYSDAQGRRREQSSRTTDHRVAERIANKLDADVALERAGVVDPRQARFAEENRRPLAQHLEVYLQQMKDAGRAAHTLGDKGYVLPRIIKDLGATRLTDLTADAVGRFLGRQREGGKAPRTVNHYREIVRAFANWCVKSGRLAVHPLVNLPKLDETRDRTRVRRALTEDELRRLMEEAGSRGRKAWYLMALWGGLRRSELKKVTWADIDLERSLLTMRVGKAHREDIVPLHPELMDELRRIRPGDVHPKTRVFPEEVTNQTRRRDFERAGIPLIDDHDRHADLHALRSTLGTMLARGGVTPQVGRQIMRHADYRTTLKHYTRLELVDAEGAIGKMASVGAESSSPPAPVVPDPQQIPQQSAHEAARTGATTCAEGGDSKPPRRKRKQLPSAKLRDDAQADATSSDERELELVGAESGLGKGCSIQLSYGGSSGRVYPAPFRASIAVRICIWGERVRESMPAVVRGHPSR